MFSNSYEGTQIFHTILIGSHALAGLVALVAGPFAMLASKGRQRHRQWGLVFFCCMVWISASALGLMLFRLNFFLFTIAFLSFHLTFSGYRAIYRRRHSLDQHAAYPVDWLVTFVTSLAGFCVVVWGLGIINPTWEGIAAASTHAQPQAVLPATFRLVGSGIGLFMIFNAVCDIWNFIRKPTDSRWWLYFHMMRMLGAYVGTLTAFLIQNVARHVPLALTPLIGAVPSIIGVIMIALWVNAYRNRTELKIV